MGARPGPGAGRPGGSPTGPAGIVHFAGDGEPCTWADLAELAVGRPVRRISSDEWGAPAPRPRRAVLALDRARSMGAASDRLAHVGGELSGGCGVKGVVLAGGFGTRLAPMTKVVNKHLLDVFDQPMVYYPLQALQTAGISDVVLVTGAEIDQFKALLGDGSELGLRLEYARQDGAGGIAEALAAGPSARRPATPLVAILGDNLYQDDLTPVRGRLP